MKFYTDEKSIFSWFQIPKHLCGYNNLVHGGIVSAALDETMGWAAIYLLKLIVLTKTMTIDFIQPVFIDNELKAQSWIAMFDDNGKVVIEATLHNDRGELCAKSKGVFSHFPPSTFR
jgi:acyl-coenzyme A thioesterase PaaI-like protein